MTNKKPNFYPVILAGGSGTRFWPRSRKKMAKQVLALDGKQTMIQQTVARLMPLSDKKRFWVITNSNLQGVIRKQLKQLNKQQIIAEPASRNTAPAIGLAAFLLAKKDPDAVLGLFPSDHVIGNEKQFRADVKRAIEIAAAGENIVVMGVKPTRAETGYGYIETGATENGVMRVRRFREKPDAKTAEQFVAAGNFYWNSGMFVWSARTLVNALNEHLPNTAALLKQVADTFGTRRFEKTFAKLFPQCENISIDYAVLEPRSARGGGASGIYCIPADFGWNDLGSWTALYEHRVNGDFNAQPNVFEASGEFALNAAGNYIHAPKKFVAAVGVSNIVVVETEDALLVTTREHAQDVGKVVKHLSENKLNKLL
jgi:mannose-1-phosphate guanylyltransferase